MPPTQQPPMPAPQAPAGHTFTILAIILLLVLAGGGYYLYLNGSWQTLAPSPAATSTGDQSGTQDVEQDLQSADVNASSTTDIDNLESQL